MGIVRGWARLTADGLPPDGVAETFDPWRIRIERRRESSGGSSREFTEAVLDPRLEAAIVEHSFDVVVIDPWRVYFAGAENSNDEVELALQELRKLSLRHGTAFLIVAHPSKAVEVREPEDLWRGASRLADWASTRVTLLPHYNQAQAKAQGMTRQQARRFVDVKFLRRAEPVEDFSIAWDAETGWWNRWVTATDVAEERRVTVAPAEVARRCAADGGEWASTIKAAVALEVSESKAREVLAVAERAGVIQAFSGARRARGYRLAGGDDAAV